MVAGTYEDMRKGIRGLEKRLREMGVRKGSRVALWSYNSANWLIAFFAIIRAGGTAVLLNYILYENEFSIEEFLMKSKEANDA